MLDFLPSDFLNEALEYDPASGNLTWRNRPRSHFPRQSDWSRWNNIYAGKPAFQKRDKDGYFCGTISDKQCRAHRVIWAMVTGAWPADKIDHWDGDTGNNRIGNLREADAGQNQHNKRFYGNAAGYKGVYKNNPGFPADTYQARITVSGRTVYIGTYATAEEAHAAYCAEAERLFGEFARAA